jgi:glycerophosphoryl diester phosphodiesterase
MTRPVLQAPLPIAVAHRGSRRLWPENTMSAFQGAVDLGFTWIETDLHVTRDGVIVCFHDDTLGRTTDRSGRVSEIDWDELAGADAGHHHGRSKGYPFRGQGIGIPRLDEVLQTFPDVRLIVDLKQDRVEDALAEAVVAWGVEDRLVVGSFSDTRMARFRHLTAGRVATSAGEGEASRIWRGSLAGRVPALPVDALQLPRRWRGIRIVTRRFLRLVHEAGLQVHVWTVNAPAVMRALLDDGVDGLITDRPDLLRAVLEDRGSWTGRP